MSERIFQYACILLFGGLNGLIFPEWSRFVWVMTGVFLVLILVPGLKPWRFYLLIPGLVGAGYLRMSQSVVALAPPISSQDNQCVVQILAQEGTGYIAEILQIEDRKFGFSPPVAVLNQPPGEMSLGSLYSLALSRSFQVLQGSQYRISLNASSFEDASVSIRDFNWRVKINRLRIYFIEKVKTSFQEFPHLKAFLLAALLQERGMQTKSLREEFRSLGLTHVLSVGGYHIALWAGILLFVLRFLPLELWLRLSLFFLAVTFYGILAGFTAPVFRSVIFAILLFVGREIQRPVQAVRILSFVLILHFFLCPAEILEPSFHLTYGITFMLLGLQEWVSHYQALLQSVILGILIQILILPYSFCFFDQSPAFGLIGVLIAPFLSPILVYGFLALYASLLVPVFVQTINTFLCPPLEAFLNLVGWLGEKLAYTFEGHLHWFWLVLCYWILGMLFLILSHRARNQAQYLVKGFQQFCDSLGDVYFPQMGTELTQAAIQKMNKNGFVSSEAEMCVSFIALWRRYGHPSYLGYMVLGPLSRHVVHTIHQKLLVRIQQGVELSKLGIEEDSISNLQVRRLLQGEMRVLYDLEKIRTILWFFHTQKDNPRYAQVFIQGRKAGLDWDQMNLFTQKFTDFEKRYMEELKDTSIHLKRWGTIYRQQRYFSDQHQLLLDLEKCVREPLELPLEKEAIGGVGESV